MGGDVWRTVGDYVTLQRGNTYSGALVGQPGPALLGLGSIEPGGGFRPDKYKTFGGECPPKIMLATGDVYVALKGATKDGSMVGSVARVPPDIPAGRLTQDTARLDFIDRRPEVADHVYWVLRTPQYRQYCAGRLTGSAAASFSRGDLLSYPVPPITPTTKAMVRLLQAIEAKIDTNRQMNETLEAIARALFKSWFVDFDPVRAKSEGCDPGLPPHLADLFPDSLEDSELGEIPKGWGTRRFGDLLDLDKGLSYKGQFLGETGMPMVNLGCFLGHGRFAELAMKYYSGGFKDRHVVRPRDLVMANTDLTQKREVIGSPALIPPREGLDKLLFTHHVFAARFGAGKEPWKLFVYFSLLQEEFRERATGFATGTTVLALPRDAVLDLQSAAPPPALIDAFDSIVQPLIERQWKATEESRTLTALRDTLLPNLISGELDVSRSREAGLSVRAVGSRREGQAVG